MRGLVARQEAQALGVNGTDHQKKHTLFKAFLQLQRKLRLQTAAVALDGLLPHLANDELCVWNKRGLRWWATHISGDVDDYRNEVSDERKNDEHPHCLVVAPVVHGEPDGDGYVKAEIEHRESDAQHCAVGDGHVR